MKNASIAFALLMMSVLLAVPATANNLSLRDALVEATSVLDLRGALAEGERYDEDTIDPSEEKSVGKAFGLSLVLPGLGQKYAGDDGAATGFFIAEAAIWTAFVVFQVQGRKREDGYQEYSQTFARVASDGHSDDYYQALTEFNSSQEYEEAIKSEGRFELYPDAAAATLQQYYLDNRVGDFEPWVWSSDGQRRDFRQQRSASKSAYRRSGYMVAAALLNRVISSFLAVRSARNTNSDLAQESSFRLEVSVRQAGSGGVSRSGITLVRNF